MVKNLPEMQDLPAVQIPGLRRVSWKREWLSTPVFLPGKPHGERSLKGHESVSERAIHSSILAWKTPWREEPEGP